ncbi:helix-turn-helix domain-containing protein [Frondihabitans peucedani]|uniref:HTH araC/xylS-type domain-containing protein n=1 Tax=Frondihabitans peucedani TaxID=598626 RepID=A0ABP8E1X3_9MICO
MEELSRSTTSGSDIDEARALYEEAYHGEKFQIEPVGEGFAYRYAIMGDRDVTLRNNRFHGSVQGDVRVEGEYVVTWVNQGRGVLDAAEQGVPVELDPGRPVLFRTRGENHFDFSDYRQNLVHFDAGYLERVAASEDAAHVGPIRFSQFVAQDGEGLATWTRTLRSVGAVLLADEQPALYRAEANRALAVAFLGAFAHAQDPLPPELLIAKHHRLRAAVDYIHAHLHLPIDPGSIAEASGLSVRGLQDAFRRVLDTTPLHYLRDQRLERVRVDLLAAAPDCTTVLDVAHRWGFTHMGRLSHDYVARFGEYPRETLRR